MYYESRELHSLRYDLRDETSTIAPSVRPVLVTLDVRSHTMWFPAYTLLVGNFELVS